MKKLMLTVVVLLVVGCGDKGGSGDRVKKASTPEQALRNMGLTMAAGDSAAFTECFDATEAEREALAAMCEYASDVKELDEAMVKAYKRGLSQRADRGNPGAAFEGDEWLDTVQIKEEGDKATVTAKDGEQTIKLVRKDGVWRIDPEMMLSQGEAEQAVMVFSAMSQAVKETRKKVGQSGYTAEKIEQELSMAMMGAMMKGFSGP